MIGLQFQALIGQDQVPTRRQGASDASGGLLNHVRKFMKQQVAPSGDSGW